MYPGGGVRRVSLRPPVEGTVTMFGGSGLHGSSLSSSLTQYYAIINQYGSAQAAQAAGALKVTVSGGRSWRRASAAIGKVFEGFIVGIILGGLATICPPTLAFIIKAGAWTTIVRDISKGRLPAPAAVGIVLPGMIRTAKGKGAAAELAGRAASFAGRVWRVFGPRFGPFGPGYGSLPGNMGLDPSSEDWYWRNLDANYARRRWLSSLPSWGTLHP